MTMTRAGAIGIALMAAILLAGPASAHVGTGSLGGLQAGFLHPIGGLDHVVAMAAVGLWGGILAKPALWLLSVASPLFMALSGVAGILQLSLPGVETGIAVSGVVLGLYGFLIAHPPPWAAIAIVAVFAVFHRYAHGAELPEVANPAFDAMGFVVATGLLNLIGIGIGMMWQWRAKRAVVRPLGGAVALAGKTFLIGVA